MHTPISVPIYSRMGAHTLPYGCPYSPIWVPIQSKSQKRVIEMKNGSHYDINVAWSSAITDMNSVIMGGSKIDMEKSLVGFGVMGPCGLPSNIAVC